MVIVLLGVVVFVPGARKRVPARGRVVTGIGRSRVVDDAVQAVRVAATAAISCLVSRQVQICQGEIDTGIQFAESLSWAEPLQIYK